MKPIETEYDIFELQRAMQALSVVSAWNELGLFKALTGGPMTLEELTAKSADERALRITVPVLMHLGLLIGDGDRVALTDSARRLQETGVLPTAKSFENMRDLSRMLDVLKEGGPVRGDDGQSKVTTGGVRPDNPAASRAFLQMLHDGADKASVDVADWTKPFLPEAGQILDLGGGHGRYAREFVERGHRATLMDLPLVIEIARERHGERLDYIAGDFLAGDSMGGPYDMIFLSNIVHGQSEDENRALIPRLAQALKPEGVLVLKDMFLDERGSDPFRAVFFGLTMLYYTARGRSYTINELDGWFEASGLHRVDVIALEKQELVIAKVVRA